MIMFILPNGTLTTIDGFSDWYVSQVLSAEGGLTFRLEAVK